MSTLTTGDSNRQGWPHDHIYVRMAAMVNPYTQQKVTGSNVVT